MLLRLAFLLGNMAAAEAASERTASTMAGNPSGLKLHPEQCSGVAVKAAVRCCSDTLSKVPANEYGCHPLETQAAAEDICRSKGFRLCHRSEILAGRTNYVGCGFDSKRVWTSTACDTERRLQPKLAREEVQRPIKDQGSGPALISGPPLFSSLSRDLHMYSSEPEATVADSIWV